MRKSFGTLACMQKTKVDGGAVASRRQNGALPRSADLRLTYIIYYDSKRPRLRASYCIENKSPSIFTFSLLGQMKIYFEFGLLLENLKRASCLQFK